MNQQKIGAFLKLLRKEKNITQEQLAEQFYVSGRTISRWETGNNMPDLSILIELADFYDVDIREIINGERKNEKMNNELKDTLQKVAEYSDVEKKKLKKRMCDISVGSLIFIIFYCTLKFTSGFGLIPAETCEHIMDFILGITVVFVALVTLYFCGVVEKINSWKMQITK